MTLALHGSYYGYNFGDTLLCRIFCDWAHDAAPDEEIILPQANARNQTLIGADGRGLARAAGARKLLFVGGGYFSEAPRNSASWSRRAFHRHVWLAEAAHALNRPYGIFGVGAGPISEPWLAARIARIVERAETVIVRDEESATFLRTIGVDRDLPVWVDAATSVPLLHTPRTSSGKILLVHCNVNPTPEELNVAREAARWGLSHPEVQVILAEDGMPRRRRKNNWALDLMSELQAPDRLTYAPYEGDPGKMLDLIRSVDAVVTTKLHMGIVSSTQHKYVVSFPVHSKTVRFYRQIGLNSQCSPLREFDAGRLGERLDHWLSGGVLDYSGLEALRKTYSYPDAVKDFVAR